MRHFMTNCPSPTLVAMYSSFFINATNRSLQVIHQNFFCWIFFAYDPDKAFGSKKQGGGPQSKKAHHFSLV